MAEKVKAEIGPYLKTFCQCRKLGCPWCSLDYRVAELVVRCNKGGDLARIRKDPAQPSIYNGVVQRIAEDVMARHSIFANHEDETDEIPEGLESPSITEAKDSVSQAAMGSVKAVNALFEQAAGSSSQAAASAPATSDRDEGAASSSAANPKAKVGGSKSARKKKQERDSDEYRHVAMAKTLEKRPPGWPNLFCTSGPVMTAQRIDARTIKGEMDVGSTSSSIRVPISIHSHNLNLVNGVHDLERHLKIPLQDCSPKRPSDDHQGCNSCAATDGYAELSIQVECPRALR